MKINQQFIKNSNLKLVYSLLMKYPGASRVTLAKMAGLSKTTVSSLVEELIRKGFVVDRGTVASTIVGRKPNHLHLTGDRHCVMVLNWEPGSLTAALVLLNGKVLHKQTIMLPNTSEYCTHMRNLVSNVLSNNTNDTEIIGNCVILSAMIDRATRKIISTILGIDNEEPIIDNVRNVFPDVPLAFFNDTACFAYAEKTVSCIEDNTFAFINLNQGVGAAFFVDGKMFGGASGRQTQFGHFSVDPNGRPCPCGNHGCLEMMIGEKVLGDLVMLCGGSKSLMNQDNIHFINIGNAAMDGDKTACLVIHMIADYLSLGLNNLISLISPSRIVIGGPGVNLGKEFLTELTNNIKSHGFHKMVDGIQLCFSSLGEDACFQGAMQYYFNTYYSFTDDMYGQTFIG